MSETVKAQEAPSWVVGPTGWVVALFVGLWGALLGVSIPWARIALTSGTLIAVFLFARGFRSGSSGFKLRWRPFILASILTIAAALLLNFITRKVEADKAEEVHARQSLQTVVDILQKKAPSKNEEVILPFNEVVCTRDDKDCLFVSNDQTATFSLTVTDLPKNRKLKSAWAVPIDNLPDLRAFKYVAASVPVNNDNNQDIINIEALRAQPAIPGRVRYAIYAVTEPR